MRRGDEAFEASESSALGCGERERESERKKVAAEMKMGRGSTAVRCFPNPFHNFLTPSVAFGASLGAPSFFFVRTPAKRSRP